MSVQSFYRESGFKLLALAKLTPCEYSIVLYLLNCAVSGLDQIITTENELALMLHWEPVEIRNAISALATRNIIRVGYGDLTQAPKIQSIRMAMQFDTHKWHHEEGSARSSHDALVFPFRRQESTNLHVLDGHRRDKEKNHRSAETHTWERVMESFVRNRSMDDKEISASEQAARTLCETHPVDQVLLMLRHFGQRIPTLSLLASSWQHFQLLFEEETQKVDLLEARQKHQELDQQVRDAATDFFNRKNELDLNEEEQAVLQILSSHRHPRRQLFWAWQMRNRYPNLARFFADTNKLMLSVTSAGTIVRKPTEP
ncbi:MAG: hypothetical protein RIQ81_490 [Pseudomonadota bacterium]|jgi:hypothetical protein